MTKRVKLEGTIKSFEWTNPHSRIWFLADTVDGKKQPQPTLWAIETGSPGQLTRMGWTKRTLNPGDKVSMAIAPLRTGEHAGLGIRPEILNGKPFPVKAGKEDPRTAQSGFAAAISIREIRKRKKRARRQSPARFFAWAQRLPAARIGKAAVLLCAMLAYFGARNSFLVDFLDLHLAV